MVGTLGFWCRGIRRRFLSGGVLVLKRADDYERALREKGKVVADFAARRALVIKGLEQAAGTGAALVADEALFDEITALVEKMTGNFTDLERRFQTLEGTIHKPAPEGPSEGGSSETTESPS